MTVDAEARAIALAEARAFARRAYPALLSHAPSIGFLASLALTQPHADERADLLARAAQYAFLCVPRRVADAPRRHDERVRARARVVMA